MEALERKIAREERMREFVREALASDAAVEEGAAVYRAKEVHPWLERLASSIGSDTIGCSLDLLMEKRYVSEAGPKEDSG